MAQRRRPVLSVDNLVSAYDRIEVLHRVSIEVRQGEIVTLVGANGAGKTTLLRAISGVQPVSAGAIALDGKPIAKLGSHIRVALGVIQVPEGRQLFAPLSVEDNLKLGAWSRRNEDMSPDLARVYAMFPMLDEMRHKHAGALSGGQQQMLAIGRALMGKPRLLLLDEPSMGLAPILVDQIFAIIRSLKADGLTILLVEQNARAALAIADRAYVLETGRITAGGSAGEIQNDARVRQAYLGV
jgi:branched-chain amino acid transport system ATP-binding protein